MTSPDAAYVGHYFRVMSEYLQRPETSITVRRRMGYRIPIRGIYMTWTLCEKPARVHSRGVQEGRRLVPSGIAEALKTKAWFGVSAVGSALPKAVR